MIVGIPRESGTGESLVAATAKTALQLQQLGYEVIVETQAGSLADQPDLAFVNAGATIVEIDAVWVADIVVKVSPPTLDDVARLRRGATIIAMMAPARSPELVSALADQGVTALAMDAVPRISRAQSIDVLSSMANVAGYRAVVEAAHEFGRMFTGQVTAAGKIAPARVFVVGAGVAGLAAIGAASAMGAIVRAFDVRPEAAEQVESLGAEFVRVDFDAQTSSDGYAREMTAQQEAATASMYDEEARAADIVITTALIPGRPAPGIIRSATVADMRTGSVIVDMAAANGGNCEGTVAGSRVVTESGVTILGYTDLPGRLAAQTSQLYGTNIVNLFKMLTPMKDGHLTLDLDDVVQRGITVVRSGKTMWPPPPVQISAAPASQSTASTATTNAHPRPRLTMQQRIVTTLGAATALFALVAISPQALHEQLTVFALAIVIGYYVIGNVHHALHTPLMSVTNAISGIILVGALVQTSEDSTFMLFLACLAILLASVNVFGGFAVTRRMLRMFSRT